MRIKSRGGQTSRAGANFSLFLYLIGELIFKAQASEKKNNNTLKCFSRLAANSSFHLAAGNNT